MARAEPAPTAEVIEAPGKVTPDEGRYAYITARAPGVVRSVSAQTGQEVRAGQLLATLDSPDVAQARLDLLTKEQLVDASMRHRGAVIVATLALIASGVYSLLNSRPTRCRTSPTPR